VSKQGRIDRPPARVRFAELRAPGRSQHLYTPDDRPRLPAILDLLHLGEAVLRCPDAEGGLARAKPLVHNRWEFVEVEIRDVPGASPRHPQTVEVAVYRPQQREEGSRE